MNIADSAFEEEDDKSCAIDKSLLSGMMSCQVYCMHSAQEPAPLLKTSKDGNFLKHRIESNLPFVDWKSEFSN